MRPCRSTPLGQPDRLPGLELGEDEGSDRGGSGGEEERLAAFELAERALGLDTRWVGVPLVVELTWLAVSVGPDGRAVERLHDATLRFDLTPAEAYAYCPASRSRKQTDKESE